MTWALLLGAYLGIIVIAPILFLALIWGTDKKPRRDP